MEGIKLKPLIGITTGNSAANEIRFVPETGGTYPRLQTLPTTYIHAVEDAGGVPVLLPIVDQEETLYGMIEHLSGVVFSGGVDVAAWHYGEHVRIGHGAIDEERDRHELNLLRRVLYQTNIPVLGICRGMQLLNIGTGGTLHQDLQTALKSAFIAHSIPELLRMDTLIHEVNLNTGSKLHQIIGETRVMVNSFHHQAVEELGNNFNASAFAPDGVVEAIEMQGDRFVLGVQWHPEALTNKMQEHAKLFSAFVEAYTAAHA